jgi:soluble lytic murein transglycosylase-like protein
MMQPGREYYFPEDKAVFEKRMQNGGGVELALDAASFIPGYVGMGASALGMGLNLYEGDYPGAALDAANIVTGGLAKGFKAASQTAKAAGVSRTARNMADKSKFLNKASNPNIYKSASLIRDYESNTPTNFGGYQDNTRVAPVVRPVKPKMQTGGLFAVGPYDEMMAPKQGKYLQPDINRPSYRDEEGGRRSEYRVGVNIDGEEVLFPTVVGGRQLTDDQAEAQYNKTGLHMGKFKTPEEAEYASRLRTARYNMLEDPVRFSADQFQGGGTVRTSMIEEINQEESLPVILDSLFSQFQKTKQEFGVEEEDEQPDTISLQTGGHVIQPGETFFGIANKYNLTKEDLIDANPGLDINTIQAGQSLKIPVIESVGQVEINAENAKTPTKWFDYLNPMNWGAPNYDDAGNFRQAFRKARVEGENDFMWYGDRYSSDLANLENKRQQLVKDIAEETEALAPIKTNRRKVNAEASTPIGIDNDILLRQAYKESTFNPNAKSPAGYMGLAQIGDEVIQDYKKSTGIRSVDPYDPTQNAAVQRWAMNQIYNSEFVNKKNQADEVRLAKTLASYNWGKGNVKNYLKRQKAKGVDIYNSLDWLEGLPQETKDYVHKIQLKDAPEFDAEFNRAIKDKRYSPYVELYQNKENGGIINTFQMGGTMSIPGVNGTVIASSPSLYKKYKRK